MTLLGMKDVNENNGDSKSEVQDGDVIVEETDHKRIETYNSRRKMVAQIESAP